MTASKSFSAAAVFAAVLVVCGADGLSAVAAECGLVADVRLSESAGRQPANARFRRNHHDAFPHAFRLDRGGNRRRSAAVNHDVGLNRSVRCGKCANHKGGQPGRNRGMAGLRRWCDVPGLRPEGKDVDQ